MKFDTQSRSSLLIINMIFEIADLNPKLKTWADLVSKYNMPSFCEIWHSEQIIIIDYRTQNYRFGQFFFKH